MGCVVVSVNVCCVFYVYCRRHDYFYCHSFTTTIVGLRDIGAAGADAGALGVLTILLSSSQLQSLDSERVRERARERLGRLCGNLGRLTVTFTVTSTKCSSQPKDQITPTFLQIVLHTQKVL